MATRKRKTTKAPEAAKPVPINADQLRAFTRKEIETGIQLHHHLKNLGYTFEELVAFWNAERIREMNTRAPQPVRDGDGMHVLTREEKRAQLNARRR